MYKLELLSYWKTIWKDIAIYGWKRNRSVLEDVVLEPVKDLRTKHSTIILKGSKMEEQLRNPKHLNEVLTLAYEDCVSTPTLLSNSKPKIFIVILNHKNITWFNIFRRLATTELLLLVNTLSVSSTCFNLSLSVWRLLTTDFNPWWTAKKVYIIRDLIFRDTCSQIHVNILTLHW